MKKSILFAMFVGGLFAANAQTGSTVPPTNTTAGPATGNVTLNVNLYPLQSIVVNSSSVVDLDYQTSANYLNGVNEDVADHLTVFSTGAFDVKVKSNNASLTGSGTAIPLTDIKILATQGTTSGATALTFAAANTAVTLSETETIIGGSDNAGSGSINVNYAAAANNAYLSRVVGGATTTYTANLTYSIIAK